MKSRQRSESARIFPIQIVLTPDSHAADMLRDVLRLGFPVAMAVLAGPLIFALNSAAKPDALDLYLVVGRAHTLNSVLDQPDVREIGPYRAQFARIVSTSADFHASLVAEGYWIFPAASLAELCGIRLRA